MKNLTDSAQNRLDKYLSQVRTSLHACTSVDADEVQRDIKEHIETELQGLSEPVSLKDIEAVLDRLGSPSQWVPDEEISWWRKIILRLHHGPEDWRLAYIAFGLLLLSFFFGGPRSRASLFLGPLVILRGSAQAILLLASFILARAAIYTVGDAKELGGQKWLIYPSLLIVYIPLLILTVIWPVITVVVIAETQTQTLSYHSNHLGLIPNYYPSSKFYTFWILAGVAVLGLWWALLGIFCCIFPKLVRAALRPFADSFKRRYIIWLIVVAVVFVVLSGGMLILFAAEPSPFHS